MKTLSYSPVLSDYEGLIVASRIVRLSKSQDGEVTYIHLIGGEIIHAEDSMFSLELRLNALETPNDQQQ